MVQDIELKKNNWFLDKEGNQVQVLALGYQVIKVLDRNAVLYSDAQPIPLTPEVLERCGFANQSVEMPEETITALAYKDTPICAYWDGVEWCFKYGFDSDLTIASCEFLHQLQNLIFMHGYWIK